MNSLTKQGNRPMATRTLILKFSPEMERNINASVCPYSMTLRDKSELDRKMLELDVNLYTCEEQTGIARYIFTRVIQSVSVGSLTDRDSVEITINKSTVSLVYHLEDLLEDDTMHGRFIEYPDGVYRSNGAPIYVTRSQLNTDYRDDSLFSTFVQQVFTDYANASALYGYPFHAVITTCNETSPDTTNVISMTPRSSDYTAIYHTFAQKLKLVITEYALNGLSIDSHRLTDILDSALDLCGRNAKVIKDHHVVLATLRGQANAWLSILNAACAFDLIGRFDIAIMHNFDDPDIIDYPSPRILFVLGDSDVILTVTRIEFDSPSTLDVPTYSLHRLEHRAIPKVISSPLEQYDCNRDAYRLPPELVSRICDAFNTFSMAKSGGAYRSRVPKLHIYEFNIYYATSFSTFWKMELTVREDYFESDV